MGKFTFDFPEELEKQMLALERAGSAGVVSRMLEAGGKKVEDEMKAQCRTHNQSGSMVKSIRTTKAKRNEGGTFVVTRPTGKETRTTKKGKKHTVRNMEKLVYLHYGTRKQSPTGIVTKVVNRAETPAVKAMQEVYSREVEQG